ncbi:MAG: hypothetical protein ACK53Y_13230, partial [bacterium]
SRIPKMIHILCNNFNTSILMLLLLLLVFKESNKIDRMTAEQNLSTYLLLEHRQAVLAYPKRRGGPDHGAYR